MDECRFERKLATFFTFAENVLALSTCKRAQVGCIVVPRDFSRVVSIGYNGQPAGLANDKCRDEVGRCGCVHAEINAMLKIADRWDRDLRVLCTTCPCEGCAGAIVNTGMVSLVAYLQEYRDNDGKNVLHHAGVQCVRADRLKLDFWRDVGARR